MQDPAARRTRRLGSGSSGARACRSARSSTTSSRSSRSSTPSGIPLRATLTRVVQGVQDARGAAQGAQPPVGRSHQAPRRPPRRHARADRLRGIRRRRAVAARSPTTRQPRAGSTDLRRLAARHRAVRCRRMDVLDEAGRGRDDDRRGHPDLPGPGLLRPRLRGQARPAGRPAQDVIRDIMSVTYKDSVQDIDSFEITINNWDADDARVQVQRPAAVRSRRARRAVRWAITGAAAARCITGEITSLRPPFPSGGGSTLAVSGLNVLHRFRTKQESHTYVNMTDSQIAEQIAGRLKVTDRRRRAPTGRADASSYLIQDNQYDIVFLMERARRIGYDLFVEERKERQRAARVSSTSRRPTVHQPTYRLTYGKSLIEFQPELTTANQVGKVTVRGWDNVQKKTIEYTATRERADDQGRRRPRRPGRDREVHRAEGRRSSPPSRSRARRRPASSRSRSSRASPRRWSRRTGSVPACPTSAPARVLEIDGRRRPLQRPLLRRPSTTHAIGDSGYTTQFECRREEV